jgi:glucose-1-phosphate cytidylyltransferase
MKVIILAGGLGTRISEETYDKPKPMVLIDDKPILWHLMNIFASQGYSDFAIALGYRGEVIKRWLIDLHELEGDIQIETKNGKISNSQSHSDMSWTVAAIETGLQTQTGGRIAKCMKKFPSERVIVTYGDGLGNIPINKLIEYHVSRGKLATVTAVRPPARFGHLVTADGIVTQFGEKNQTDAGWINGGFFVLEPEVMDMIGKDSDPFESTVLPELTKRGELAAFHHEGFWQPMDTLREKNELARLVLSTPPPWLNFN